MDQKQAYPCIDAFRFLAALLVVTIHTDPLSSFSVAGNLVLSRILARVAVPFFFMTSGFFLISPYTKNVDKLIVFLKKTALIYGVAILFYLPLNLYAGYFQADAIFPRLFADLLFNGTLYHLWYLPASMLGAVLAWFLVKKAGFSGALLLSGFLYLLGLLGDSYYGLAQRLPALQALYRQLFQLFSYSRNGLFFAPVFFVLGALLADRRTAPAFPLSLTGFLLSLSAMVAEGILLHRAALPRHDSMYLFLLPCMYFLFSLLCRRRGCRQPGLQYSALILYLVHPMLIAALHFAAKLLNLQALLMENSLLHFLAVSALSIAVALPAGAFLRRLRARRTPLSAERAWLEVSLQNLRHNCAVLEAAMPPDCALMAVVKADAYGHGAFETATCLARDGVRAFAVATLAEGVALRRAGIPGEILILGWTDPAQARILRKYKLSQTVPDLDYALHLDKQGVPCRVHIKIDSGMHRLGIPAAESARVLQLFHLKHVHVQGIYTHLCVADSRSETDRLYTRGQIEAFYALLDQLEAAGIPRPKIHIQSSYGLLNYPELHCDYVRAGIALYGVPSAADEVTRLQPELLPVLSLRSRLVQIQKLKAGDRAGYGLAFTAERDTVLAVVSIGYADGLPRSLSCGKGEAVLRGHRVPIAGRVCMDQLTLDVTDVPDVAVGDPVTLIGSGLSATLVASAAGSIPNELFSRLGTRLPRHFVDSV